MIDQTSPLNVPLLLDTPRISSQDDSQIPLNPHLFNAREEENQAGDISTGHQILRCLDEETQVESDLEWQKTRGVAVDWVQYWHWITKGCHHIDSLGPLVLKRYFLKSCEHKNSHAEIVIDSIYKQWEQQTSRDLECLIAHYFNVCINFTSAEFSEEKIEQVWEFLGSKLAKLREEPEQDLPSSSLIRIAQRLASKQISFSTLSSFLQLIAFRWLMLDPANRKNCHNLISLSLHDRTVAIRITIPGKTQKSTLILPFTPQKALNCIKNTLSNTTLKECLIELLRDFAPSFRFVLEKNSPLKKGAENFFFVNKEIHDSALALIYHPLLPIHHLAIDILHATHVLQPTFSTFRTWLEFLPEILEREHHPVNRMVIRSILEWSFSLFLPELHQHKKEKFLNLLLKHIQKTDFDAASCVVDVLPWMVSINHKKVTRFASSLWQRWLTALTPRQAKSLGFSLYRTSITDAPELSHRIASILLEMKMMNSNEGQEFLREIADLLNKDLPLPEQLQTPFVFVYLLKLLGAHFPEQIIEYERTLFSLLAQLLKKGMKYQVLSIALAAGSQHVVSDPAFLSATLFYAREPSTSNTEEIQNLLQQLLNYLADKADHKDASRFDVYLYLFDTIASSYRPILGTPQKKIEEICLEIFQQNPSVPPNAFIKLMSHCLKNNLIITDSSLANLWLNACKRACKENIVTAATFWKAGNQSCVWNYLNKKEHAQFLFSFARDLLNSDHHESKISCNFIENSQKSLSGSIIPRIGRIFRKTPPGTILGIFQNTRLGESN